MAAAPRRSVPSSPAPARRTTRAPVRALKGPQARRATGTATTPGRNIRWDRVGRTALLLVLIGIVGLYVGPLHSYWSTRHEAAARHSEVVRLQHENARLRGRRAALRSKGTLEKEARRLGMVRPGERPFVVRGLPKGP